MNQNIKRFTIPATFALLGMLLMQAGCVSKPSTAAELTPARPIGDIANEVTQDIGEVRQVNTAGTKGPIFVFEEFHTSRPGRVQSAMMLLRLYRKHGLKTIGLEGAFQSDKPLDGIWFRNAGGTTAKLARETIAIQMLSDGEINQAEFMVLLFSDMTIHGTERQEEHKQPDVKGNPEVVYLLGVAEALMSNADKQRATTLFNANKNDEAFKLMINAVPWVRHYYDAMGNVADLDAVVARLNELQAKAQTLNVAIEQSTKRELQNLITFYELRAKASDTMVAGVLQMIAANPGSPTAMIIGAAHTDKVIKLLTKEKVTFAVLRSRDFNPEADSLSGEQFDKKGKGQFVWTASGTLGQLLNGEVNPPPITQTAAGKSYANMHLASLLIADASRNNKPLPDALWDELSKLPEVRIDKTSFSKDGYDVVFRAWLKGVDGKEKEVWARVGTTNNPADTRDLELKLLDADKRFSRKPPTPGTGGGGKKGGGGSTRKTAEDHPERPKKAGREITPLGPTALAVFGNTKESVGAIPRISG
ncbi:MAG TPA: hypothetical protein VNV82_12015 [Bryobacteraceae bacterium]|jgi:hypothetical protein|nr:hypothetical protein [Bryobacteraceae bacterium]